MGATTEEEGKTYYLAGFFADMYMNMKVIGPRVKSQLKKYIIVYSCWCSFT